VKISISIFTPTHDSRFLRDAYESIKAQDFHEWILVYNNGAQVLDFGDPRVKSFVWPNAPPWVGPLKAYACERATGDVLLELDHDDLLTPDALAEVAAAFDDPAVGFVYSNTIHATGDLQPVRRFDECWGWKFREVMFQGHQLDEHISFEPSPESVSRIWYAPNHLRAFRRDVYQKVGGYSWEMRILDDLDLMCRLYQATKFKHIDKGLYVYRVHGQNSWLRYNAEIQQNVYRIYDQYIERLVLRWAEMNGLSALDLGGRPLGSPSTSTSTSTPASTSTSTYSSVDLKDADVCCDLNGAWPFEDSSVGVIRAFDVFEHLRDPLHTMREVSRVLAPGGWLFCQVPSTDGRGAFSDPTHRSFWNELSFAYYTRAVKAKYIDTPVRLQAPRLYTTEKDTEGVCWVVAHLINLKGGYRPCGAVEI